MEFKKCFVEDCKQCNLIIKLICNDYKSNNL